MAAIARLRELGHRVGLHGLYPDATCDARFDPVVAWHTPDPEYMSVPIRGVVNVMQDGVLRSRRGTARTRTSTGAAAVRTTSSPRAASTGCSCSSIPEIWVYDGATMRETMASQLAAEHELRWRQLAENRIDLT